MSSTPRPERFRPTRRGLVRTAVAGGGAVLVGAAVVGSAQAPVASQAPNRPVAARITGPDLVMWGSSTIADVHHDLEVPETLETRLEVTVARRTGIPVRSFGIGGEQSPQIAARRGVADRRYKLRFDGNVIPESGTAHAVLDNPHETAWSGVTTVTGWVQDVLGRLEAIPRRPGEYRFTRLQAGEARFARPGGSGTWFSTTQEAGSRSSRHLLHIGRNNIGQRETIRADTEACFDLAPEDSMVMGMFRLAHDAPGSRRALDVDAYNDWGRRTYGRLFLDVEDFLRTNYDSPRFATMLKGSRVGGAQDAEDVRAGRIPRSLYSYDGLHLNGWGYLLVGEAISEKVRQLGWTPHAED